MAETLQVHAPKSIASEATSWGETSDPTRDRLRPGAGTRSPQPLVSIAAGCSFEGLLTFRGEAQVDGELVGEVVATGTLRLGKQARVRARIEVDELIVEGQLEGDVVARRRIELLPSARVTGSIDTPSLSLADGCVFQGRCHCVA